MSESIIVVGVRVKDKHWAQGYHRAIGTSSKDFEMTCHQK